MRRFYAYMRRGVSKGWGLWSTSLRGASMSVHIIQSTVQYNTINWYAKRDRAVLPQSDSFWLAAEVQSQEGKKSLKQSHYKMLFITAAIVFTASLGML